VSTDGRIGGASDSRSGSGSDTGPVLVLGGRSEIGLAVAERLAARGTSTFVLAARRPGELDAEEAALRGAGASTVGRVEFDADDLSRHAAVIDEVSERFGPPSTVVVAFGVLGDQATAERDPTAAVAVVHTDYVAHVHVLTLLANRLRAAGSGTIVVFSSVAGVRVRRANYVYGSAKAGLDGFASGLADALHGSGVRLVLVRPGFVVGRMTAGMSPAPLSSTPDQVADAVVAALASGRDVVWVPPVLRPVFSLMRLLPRAVWRRLPR
jgi:NAD(P)-dependent dehydrogenase (short-subunit alcohol dehydrogenase family)